MIINVTQRNCANGWVNILMRRWLKLKSAKILVVVGPRKFKFPKNHKLRHQYTFHKGKLHFGNVGLRILNPCCVDSAHFFRLRMLMNRATRKPDKTYRTFWFMYFPHFPVSKKPQGARMGKGKGPRCAWRAHLKPGRIFIETKNVRPGRSLFFFNQVSRRLSFTWEPVYRYPKRIRVPDSKYLATRAAVYHA